MSGQEVGHVAFAKGESAKVGKLGCKDRDL
jgi:hypothetical protein